MLREFEELDYKKIWEKFYDLYGFEPSVDPRKWPGIVEPSPSLTISLTESKNGKWPEKDEVIQFFKEAFNQLEGNESIAYILDWCHKCYYAPEVFDDRLWVYPDGDYAICLNKKISTGTFGHPWERTICVFGSSLIEITKKLLIKSNLKVIRENT